MGAPIIWNGVNAKTLTDNTYNKSGVRYALISDVTSGAAMVPSSKSANFTAAAAFMYLCDTSASAFTATLPSGAANAQIRFIDSEQTWATYNLTVTPASGQKIMGLSTNESLICDVSGSWVELVWDASNSWWTVTSNGAVNSANVEYAYSTSTLTTAGGTQSDDGLYGYGTGGTQFNSIAANLTGNTKLRVRFTTAIQPTDDIAVEVLSVGQWIDIGTAGDFDVSRFTCSNNANYGIGVYPVSGSTTDVYVVFGNAGRLPNYSSIGAAGSVWSGVAGSASYKWRVRKTSGRSVSYPEVVPGVTAGLVAAQGLKGSTTGASIASGYVGEILSANVANSVGLTTSINATTDITGAAVAVTPGIYLVCATIVCRTTAQVGNGDMRVVVRNTAGTYLIIHEYAQSINSYLNIDMTISFAIPIAVTAATTLTLGLFQEGGTSTSTTVGNSGTRYFAAVRLA